ncbi:MAG: tetratricopeptide repeat protein [Bacteroidota bacterium]
MKLSSLYCFLSLNYILLSAIHIPQTFGYGTENSITSTQSTKADSLETALKTVGDDTARVKILNELSREYQNIDPEKALEYARQGMDFAERSDFKKGMATCLNTLGDIYNDQFNYDKAIDCYIRYKTICEELQNQSESPVESDRYKSLIASTLNSIGSKYYYQGDYQKSIYYYLQSIKIYEKLADSPDEALAQSGKKGIAMNMNNLGEIHRNQGNYDKAIDYYRKSLSLIENLADISNDNSVKQNIAVTLSNIGVVYMNQGNYEKTLDYFMQSLKIDKELGNKKGIAETLSNVGIVYYYQGNYDVTLNYFMRSLEITEEMGDKRLLASSLNNIGELYSELGKYAEAIEYIKRSIDIAKDIGIKDDIKIFYQSLAEAYAKYAESKSSQGIDNNYKNAYEYFRLHSEIKDSLFNEERSKQITEMQEKYESEKKEKEIEILSKEKNIQNLEIKKGRIIKYALTGGVVMLILLSFVIYNRYRLKHRATLLLRKQNIEIVEQKKEIERQKKIVDEKNKDITDSIEYASNIQQAILPQEHELQKTLPNHFVFFRPRDIVSGDFYWFRKAVAIGEGRGMSERAKILSIEPETISPSTPIFIAACDCTGHGVPGAFVSMIGNDLLNQIVIEKGITKPGEILSLLNKGVKSVFTREGYEQQAQDGMDIALCCLSPALSPDLIAQERDTPFPFILQYAGANNPLLIYRKDIANSELIINGKVFNVKADNSHDKYRFIIPGNSLSHQSGGWGGIEIKGDRVATGGRTEVEYIYTNHKIELQKGDSFYIFSDGYIDQFGGTDGKKFGSKPFKELLLSIQDKNMKEQKEIINQTIDVWKGDEDQLDDILVIGVKI